MVEEIRAYRTKYGTIVHEKILAEELEKEEARSKFASEFADIFKDCRMNAQGDVPEYRKLLSLGRVIIENPDNLVALLHKYEIAGVY